MSIKYEKYGQLFHKLGYPVYRINGSPSAVKYVWNREPERTTTLFKFN